MFALMTCSNNVSYHENSLYTNPYSTEIIFTLFKIDLYAYMHIPSSVAYNLKISACIIYIYNYIYI